jgi:hypothetical protein
MKIIFTFEYADLLEHIIKVLAMSGIKPVHDTEGNPRVVFNNKQKEVVIHGEASTIPNACLFCGSHVNVETSDVQVKSQTEITKYSSNEENETSQAITGDKEENVPMSMAALRAQSNALVSRKDKRPRKIQPGADAHAALVTNTLLEGESTEPPGEGDF